MILKTDYQASDVSALVQYLSRDDGERVPVKDHTGTELEKEGLKSFVDRSSEYDRERHVIISPDPDAEFDADEVSQNTRRFMQEWRAENPSVEFVYAVHDGEIPHAHVALTGKHHHLDLDIEDLQELREQARNTFREVERLSERERTPEAEAEASAGAQQEAEPSTDREATETQAETESDQERSIESIVRKDTDTQKDPEQSTEREPGQGQTTEREPAQDQTTEREPTQDQPTERDPSQDRSIESIAARASDYAQARNEQSEASTSVEDSPESEREPTTTREQSAEPKRDPGARSTFDREEQVPSPSSPSPESPPQTGTEPPVNTDGPAPEEPTEEPQAEVDPVDPNGPTAADFLRLGARGLAEEVTEPSHQPDAHEQTAEESVKQNDQPEAEAEAENSSGTAREFEPEAEAETEAEADVDYDWY